MGRRTSCDCDTQSAATSPLPHILKTGRAVFEVGSNRFYLMRLAHQREDDLAFGGKVLGGTGVRQPVDKWLDAPKEIVKNEYRAARWITLQVMVSPNKAAFATFVSHNDWRIDNQYSSALTKSLVIGRDPGKGGLVVGQSDPYISSKAIELTKRKDGVEVRNTGSQAEFDVQQSSALRHIFPGEGILMIASFTIFLPSKDFTYQIKVEIDGLHAPEQLAGGTQSLVSQRINISDERIPSLAGLCASYLYPGHFGTSPMKASQIAEILTNRGYPVTAKAVKHKIQRTKDQVEQATGNIIDDREGLAQFLIRNHLVTGDHIRHFLLGEASEEDSKNHE